MFCLALNSSENVQKRRIKRQLVDQLEKHCHRSVIAEHLHAGQGVPGADSKRHNVVGQRDAYGDGRSTQ